MSINFLKTLHLQILHYTMTVWLFFNSLIIMWNGKHLRGLSGSLFFCFRWQVISSSWLWNLSRNKKKSERKKGSAREVVLLVRRATSEGKSYRVRSRFLLALVSLRKLKGIRHEKMWMQSKCFNLPRQEIKNNVPGLNGCPKCTRNFHFTDV